MCARVKIVAAIALCASFSTRLFAVTDEQPSRIEELAQSNGVGLQCKYFQETQRIKQALVAMLPNGRFITNIAYGVKSEQLVAKLDETIP